MQGEPKQYYVIVKNASDLPVYNLLIALHWRGSTEAFTLTLPEYLVSALMSGDIARIPPEGGITWDAPKGPQPIWSQAWFRDADSVHWTITSKGEIVERPGPPLITSPQGRPADLDRPSPRRGLRDEG
jgi:hypothetical protein